MSKKNKKKRLTKSQRIALEKARRRRAREAKRKRSAQTKKVKTVKGSELYKVFGDTKPSGSAKGGEDRKMEAPKEQDLSPLTIEFGDNTGMTHETTAYKDLEIAEVFGKGKKDIKETIDSIEMNLSGNLRLLTEFIIILGWRTHLHAERGNTEIAKFYNSEYEALIDRVVGTFDEMGEANYDGLIKTPEELTFYFQETN